MLITKSATQGVSDNDGYTILIVSRPTHNDGVTPDERLDPEKFDAWWPELAPSPVMVGLYYAEKIDWVDFKKAYFERLQGESWPMANELIKLAKKYKVTVFCIETSPAFCHRGLLAEFCQQADRTLNIVIG